MTVEVELKYRAHDADALRRLATVAALGPARLGPPRSGDEVDRYLDTADRHLAGHHWACRLRSRDGTTRLSMKGPPDPGTAGALHRRPELEGPAGEGLDPAAWPASEARALLDRLRGGARLVELVRLEQRRTERAVRLAGVEVGTLSLDAVRVVAPPAELGTLHVVELELLRGSDGTTDEAPIAALDAALSAIEGLSRDERTKLEHALRLLAER